LLSKHQGAATTASFVDRLVSNAYTYERDPEKFYEVRRKIGERIAEK